MNKKLLAMLTVLAMLIGLTACGASKSESTASETSTVVTTEKTVTEESAQEETVSELEDVPATAVEEQTIADMIGSTIIFGSYEQDNDTVNGAEDIEWIVLDQNGDNVLLFSKYALDTIPYNNENAGVTWETSTLRSWLNGEFYSTAFSAEEQSCIETTTVTAEKNPEYDTDPGADTQDKVFLLSLSEAKRYSKLDDENTCVATPYALGNGATTDYGSSEGACYWWLRSPGGFINDAVVVTTDGYIMTPGFQVDFNDICVRPALWVNLASAETAIVVEGDAQKDNSSETRLSAMADAEIGSTVFFGTYNQDSYTENGAEEIEWIVLDRDGDNVLLLSKYALYAKPFNAGNIFSDVSWEECSLRSWLNKTFYSVAFTAEEQNVIKTTTVTTEGSNDTQDKLFLLSISEAEQYFPSAETRVCSTTSYARENGAFVDTGELPMLPELSEISDIDEATEIPDIDDIFENAACWWWLRSPGSTSSYAAYVETDGSIDVEGTYLGSFMQSVRPAMWVNLASLGDATTDAQEEKEKFAGAELGSTVFFGAYEQDNDASNGAEEIEWLVLDRDGDDVLLISKCALEAKPYNVIENDVTWENCTLRRWLNNDFYDTAFSAEEQCLIKTTMVTAYSNPKYDTSPGNDTEDKIYLLSILEVEKYLPTAEERECAPTNQAVADKAYLSEDGNSWWWLRSPGETGCNAARVCIDGAVSNGGLVVNTEDGSIRPVMWVNLAP